MTQTPGQRTASTVLDLIDGAIGGDTSPDAMRWTPEPEGDQYRGWLEPSPAARAAMEAREIALIMAQFPPRREPPPSPRTPVVEAARPGTTAVSFVGGPWANDLRAMPLPLKPQWLVAPITPLTFTTEPDEITFPEPICYTLRSVTGQFWPMDEPKTWQVYAAPDATHNELEAAVMTALDAGWRP